jgi:hypothetical protein
MLASAAHSLDFPQIRDWLVNNIQHSVFLQTNSGVPRLLLRFEYVSVW